MHVELQIVVTNKGEYTTTHYTVKFTFSCRHEQNPGSMYHSLNKLNKKLGKREEGAENEPPDSCYYPTPKRKILAPGWERINKQLSAGLVLTNELSNGALAFCCHRENAGLQNYIKPRSLDDCQSDLKLLSVSLRQPNCSSEYSVWRKVTSKRQGFIFPQKIILFAVGRLSC